MNWEMIRGVVRHILTFGGGFLVTNGVADAAQVETAVGALVALIGVAWSIYRKWAAKV